MWAKFLECTEEILSVGEISRVYSRDPQCGGISRGYRRDPQCGGISRVYRRDTQCVCVWGGGNF